MKIFNYIKDDVCVPIAANNLQEAHGLFFKAEGYEIKIDGIPPSDDKDQFKLFDMDELEKEWAKGWEQVDKAE